MTAAPSFRRLLSYAIAAALLAAVMFVYLSPATPAFAECRPDGLPDFAGNAVPGQLDPAVESPTGGNYYGQYGWSGLKWYTCDIQDVGAFAPDMIAILDTWFGNAFMGVAVLLASIMTALHKWMAEPSTAFAAIDEKITQLSDITIELFFDDWAMPAIVFAGVTIVAAAITKNIRSVGLTLLAVVGAVGFVAVVGYAPVQIAQSTDGVASSIVSAADQSALEVAGIPESGGTGNDLSASPEEATGAVLNDAILQPFWRLGQTGTTEWLPTTDAMFTTSTVRWDQVADGFDPEAVAEEYDQAVEEVKNDEELSGQYTTIKGQSYNRAGAGFMAMATVAVVAMIRIPAEALIFLGMLVIRFIPILGPIFALLAIIPMTRGAATAALKVVAASIYNVIVFGVIASVHTGITALLYVGATNLFVSLLISTIVTFLLWQLSKPFRSVTKLATGEAVARHLAEAPDAPGKAVKGVIGMATGTVMGSLGVNALERRRAKRGESDNRITRPDRAHPGRETETSPMLVHPGWREAPPINTAWNAEPAGPTANPGPAGSSGQTDTSAAGEGETNDGQTGSANGSMGNEPSLTAVDGVTIDTPETVQRQELVTEQGDLLYRPGATPPVGVDASEADFFVPAQPTERVWWRDAADDATRDGIWLPDRVES